MIKPVLVEGQPLPPDREKIRSQLPFYEEYERDLAELHEAYYYERDRRRRVNPKSIEGGVEELRNRVAQLELENKKLATFNGILLNMVGRMDSLIDRFLNRAGIMERDNIHTTCRAPSAPSALLWNYKEDKRKWKAKNPFPTPQSSLE